LRRACGSGAKCIDIPGSYLCECAPGYAGDPYGKGCELMDACAAFNPCDIITQVCKSANNEAYCVCKEGFLNNAVDMCVPDPCLIDNGGCGRDATCRPTRVEELIVPKCRCPVGFELDFENNCIPIDHCKCQVKTPLGIPCKSEIMCIGVDMLCVDYGTEYNCTCQSGYTLSPDGTQCINIDECVE
uniref:Dumpy (inferred by orthology to a D. melanogaster protein) n=1 Tax=Anisakis simplex TaxID=6269 RepID=A0A0M3JAY0_ANISI